MSGQDRHGLGGPATSNEGGLAELAAVLGPVQPDDPKGELLDAHFERLDLLCAAAPVLAIHSASDAALAVSVIAEIAGRVRDEVMSEAQLRAEMNRQQAVAARLGTWLMEQHGARPLALVWTHDATPYPDLYARLPHRAEAREPDVAGQVRPALASSIKAGPAP